MGDPDPTTVAFVCVQNAGRSQMAAAFAKRALAGRGRDADIEVITGGTRPADRIHPSVVDAMLEVGIDLTQRSPRAVTVEELQSCDIIVTMGCSAEAVCPAGWAGDSRDWALDDPHGKSLEAVREIREEIRQRTDQLFDELVTE